MDETAPSVRRDLEFFPVQDGGRDYVVIRDPLGLVDEGKAVGLPLYQIMVLLDGTRTLRDLQGLLMRERGGLLVGTDELRALLFQLDESFLLDSDMFKKARDRIIADFTEKRIRPCSHCGRSYPEDPTRLKDRLDEIVNSQPYVHERKGKIEALVAPHIDLEVGSKAYSSAYQMLKYTSPSRVVLLGIGHQMQDGLFSLTRKDFETPLGVTKSEQGPIHRLHEAGGDIIAANDFVHRSEHSIEFQLIFLQHMMADEEFTIIPILCGSLQAGLSEYTRDAYQDKAGPFLENLKQILSGQEKRTLIVAGVDLSHTGFKFGHEMPATHLQNRSETHDRNLLRCLMQRDVDGFWEESRGVNDQFNVCGFSALACLLEVLPPCHGEMLDYEIWHEGPTKSAVSFSSVVFTS